MIIKDTVEPTWSEETYRKYDELISAINDFGNALMPARNIRNGDTLHLMDALEKINLAVANFDVWLDENERLK